MSYWDLAIFGSLFLLFLCLFYLIFDDSIRQKKKKKKEARISISPPYIIVAKNGWPKENRLRQTNEGSVRGDAIEDRSSPQHWGDHISPIEAVQSQHKD